MDIGHDPVDWHAVSADQALQALGSTRQGLGATEAAERLAAHGPNRLPAPPPPSRLRRLALQFHNLLIYILLIAGVLTLALGHLIDAGVIFGVVVINALIGYVQEGKAEDAMAAIRAMLSPHATVLRDGHYAELDAADIVVGDLVLLQAGDRVPADVRLLSAHRLRIDESALTGESVPVDKQSEATPEQSVLAERHSMAYSGTLVVNGQGLGLVAATGSDTEIGRINILLAGVETLTTPLLKQIAGFSRTLTGLILGLAVFTVAVGVGLRGESIQDMFLAAVALAVAAIPEGLPAIITITLAIGVRRMAARNVIIRRLPAVETLGAVSVVCTDKTGTLTRNEMTVVDAATAIDRYAFGGVGYAPFGGIERLDDSIAGSAVQPDEAPDLMELLRGGLLCNDGDIAQQEQEWVAIGDPMDAALVALARKGGLDPAYEREAWPRADVVPFESQRQFMATLHRDHAGHAFVVLKGAPERILDRCNSQRAHGQAIELEADKWHTLLDSLAAQGQRVLAVAYKALETSPETLELDELESGFSLLGLLGFIDPPREEASAAVAAAQSAGIRVKMITGDHAATAAAIGASLGLSDASRVLTGPEIDGLDVAQLRQAVHDSGVIARAAPEHKLRLIEALQAEGQTVAMTGDGVNDAPALKRADVGVAMGRKGTEAAKEAAEIVVTDDNFASIIAGVEEGRTAYDNIRKAILFILPTNGAEALVIIAAILSGTWLPITPVQILWINMITAVTLALALAFEPPETAVMRRRPRAPHSPLLSRFLLWRIALVSLLLLAAVDFVFFWLLQQGADIDTARTAAVNMLVLGEASYLLNARYLSAATTNRNGLFGNRWALLAIALVLFFQLLLTYAPPMQLLFSTAPLNAGTWLLLLAFAVALYGLIEVEKMVVRRRSKG
ncbi:MAG: HAD-IC family P-type ATPase [Acidihalobacter sp.]|uniref:HAD-IC family P-type ATPase n=1 Tax=Acidihalobacter sp. TaxID=1872108 RepID=UPI00307D77D4